jgi:uncharacterized membrane protein YdjX (TVP38/TMEM64 family)
VLLSKHGKPLVLAALVVTMLIAVALLPLAEWLAAAIAWVEALGALAWGIFVVTYIVAAVLIIPGSILTLTAGLMFGLPLGVVLVSAGSVLGAASAFLVGRFLARDWVRERVAHMPSFNALDMATRHEGFLIVLLARLSPLFPFNLLNYGLGLTAVRFRDYFLASWIGMLPATVLYVYVGTLARDITEITAGQVEGGLAGRILLVAGLIATLILTILITRKATGTLRRHLQQESASAEQHDEPTG